VIAIALDKAHFSRFQCDFDATTARTHITSGEFHLLLVVIFNFYGRSAHKLFIG